MHKSDSRFKEWQKRANMRKFRHKLKRKGNHTKNKKEKTSNTKKIDSKPISLIAPTSFSIIENPEETVEFLNKLIDKIERVRKQYEVMREKHKAVKEMKIDMSNTTKITGDVLMYLLTIMKNTKGYKQIPTKWSGNFPKDERISHFMKASGFLKYMETSDENLIQTYENIQIQTGKSYEYLEGGNRTDIRTTIIDFTCRKLNKDKSQIDFLMTMLTEMITNINDHAYNQENLFEPNWYIFVENKSDRISYTFMDNGQGIPTTIKKNWKERIKKFLTIDKEYQYIEAGVSGLEHRSQTGQVERGNGLPSIYEQYTKEKISNLTIISNRGYFDKNKPRDLPNGLNGTMFYWEIQKEENTNGN